MLKWNFTSLWQKKARQKSIIYNILKNWYDNSNTPQKVIVVWNKWHWQKGKYRIREEKRVFQITRTSYKIITKRSQTYFYCGMFQNLWPFLLVIRKMSVFKFSSSLVMLPNTWWLSYILAPCNKWEIFWVYSTPRIPEIYDSYIIYLFTRLLRT
jgi:hypothetical protein